MFELPGRTATCQRGMGGDASSPENLRGVRNARLGHSRLDTLGLSAETAAGAALRLSHRHVPVMSHVLAQWGDPCRTPKMVFQNMCGCSGIGRRDGFAIAYQICLHACCEARTGRNGLFPTLYLLASAANMSCDCRNLLSILIRLGLGRSGQMFLQGFPVPPTS